MRHWDVKSFLLSKICMGGSVVQGLFLCTIATSHVHATC